MRAVLYHAAVVATGAAVALPRWDAPPAVGAPAAVVGAGAASAASAAFPGDACGAPRLPPPARLALAVGPHPVARALTDAVRRIVVVARGDGGAGPRLVIVGPVARAGRAPGTDDAILAGVARLYYHGATAHLCSVGPAYLRDGAGRFGPGAQGWRLELVADGTTLLAQADIWTASAAYHVVGRLVALPGRGPDADPITAFGALAPPLATTTMRRPGGAAPRGRGAPGARRPGGAAP